MKYNITFASVAEMQDACTKYRLTASDDLVVNVPLSVVPAMFRAGAALQQTEKTVETFYVKPSPVAGEVGEAVGFGLRKIQSDDFLVLLSDSRFEDVTPAQAEIKLLADGDVVTALTDDNHWHQVRVTSRMRPFHVPFEKAATDQNVEVFVLDSGINKVAELANTNIVDLYSFTGNFGDTDNHGTAIASLIAGENLGVVQSSAVTLLNCKIFEGDTRITIEELIDCVTAIINHHTANPKPRIANFSWVVAKSAAIDSLVTAMVDAGITVICAAGNSGLSASELSPASLPNVVTVGSIDASDNVSAFSNTGSCVNLLAPGEGVTCVWGNEYVVKSGTSFACAVATSAAVGLIITFGSVNQSIILNFATPFIFTQPDQPRRIAYCTLNVHQASKFMYAGYLDRTSPPLTVRASDMIEDPRLFTNGAIISLGGCDNSAVTVTENEITIPYIALVDSAYVIDRSIEMCNVDVKIGGSVVSQTTVWWYNISPEVSYFELGAVSESDAAGDYEAYVNSFPQELIQTMPVLDIRLAAGNIKN